jgi:hypothetical protein
MHVCFKCNFKGVCQVTRNFLYMHWALLDYIRIYYLIYEINHIISLFYYKFSINILNIAFQNIVSINNRFVSKCQDKNYLVIYSFVTDYNWKKLVPVHSITLILGHTITHATSYEFFVVICISRKYRTNKIVIVLEYCVELLFA